MSRVERVELVRHRCARCGASCEGLKAAVRPDEHAALAAAAEQLGVSEPFEGAFLRQEGGRCVFYADGCRIHAELGAASKPQVCRQFPFVYSGVEVGIDPACFHADPSPDGDLPARAVPNPFAPPPERHELPWYDLELGHLVREELLRLPAASLLHDIGPLTASLLPAILEAEPAFPHPFYFEERVRTALRFALVPATDPVSALVGGAQLVAGSGVAPGPGFAAFMRLMRTGVL